MPNDTKTAETAAPKLRFFGLGKLRPYVGRYKGLFATMVVCTILVGTLNVLTPLFQRYAIDNFIAEKTLDGLAAFIALYVVFIAASCVLEIGRAHV